MFIRWKHRKERHTAYLVKSVRKEGKPRQEVIATLCSLTWDAKGGLSGWANLELKVPKLGLTEDEQAHVYQLFAQKVPRPPEERLQKEKKEIVALLAQVDAFTSRVVPNSPALRNIDTTTDASLSIRWVGKAVFRNRLQYTAFLVMQDGKEIKLGAEDSTVLSAKYNGAFWFSVHCALCRAKVDYATYEKVLHLLENWVHPLDNYVREMTWRTSLVSSQLEREKKALYRKLLRLDTQSDDIRAVYHHSTSMRRL